MLETPRLRLTPMGLSHLHGLSEMNADSEVMAHFPDVMTHEQSTAHLGRMQAHWAAHSFGLLALHHKETNAFLGFTGLTHPGYKTRFTPCVEVGWRLHRSGMGQRLCP